MIRYYDYEERDILGHWLIFGVKLEVGRSAEEVIEKLEGREDISLERLCNDLFR